MTAKSLLIRDAARYPKQGEHDYLLLKEGVNVMVGEMNAGKTKWLQMIDYVLGDKGNAEAAFDKELADIYERIVLKIEIEGEEFEVERRWKEAGTKSKIIVNEKSMTTKEFSQFMLCKLCIPLIQVPSGNPYGDRTWPELSWRELLRHMYKQERFWSDFTQKQSEIVRSACILHFMDAAKHLYSSEYGQFIAKRKEHAKLEAKKDVFVGVLQDISVDLVDQPEMTVAVTPDAVSETRNRLNSRLAEIEAERKNLLKSEDEQKTAKMPGYSEAKQRLESLHMEIGQLEIERNKSIHRHAEMTKYAVTLEAELSRFARAKSGAAVFADLKVTHCPACDQKVPSNQYGPEHCKVCGQLYNSLIDDESAGMRRIEFEEQQITEELEELRNLIAELEQKTDVLTAMIANIQQVINTEQQALAAAKDFAIRAIPPEFAMLDREAGKIGAQLAQIDRIERSLDSRDQMNRQIGELENEIDALNAEIKQMTPKINYQDLSDLISDRMNDYLNALNMDKRVRWKAGRVSVNLRKDSFNLFLEGQPWTIRAGGTVNYIIQIAYHYALFSLTKDKQYNYPGFLIIDFPPHFVKAEDLQDSESYLLEPFVKLCSINEMKNSQVIVAGRAFENLLDVNTIYL